LTGEFLSRQSNSQRATDMALDELYGVRDPQGQRFLEHVKNVDAAELKKVATQYLNNPVVTVISGQPIPEEALSAAVNGEPLPEPESNEAEAEQGAATQPAN
jgi:predicted Zn-dependent peptidase